MDINGKNNKAVTVILFTLAASFVYMMNCGIRNNFGIMLSAITENAGLTFTSVSFVLAVGQLCFGITQPIFGIVADKKGSRFSLLTGIICTLAGVLLTPMCKSVFSLMLILGILLPGGIGAISYGVIISTINPKLPAGARTTVSGIVNASSGIGNTLLTPILSASIAAGGLVLGMSVLAVFTAAMIPVTLLMCGKNTSPVKESKSTAPESKITTSEFFRLAFKNRDYVFIVIGFFTCGFHMALITNHIPTQISSYGYTSAETSAAFSIYGVATMIGALVSGALCSRIRMKNVLGTLYTARTFIVLLFFILPKTMPVICTYIFLLGFTGSATVSPVSGICGKLFGAKGVAILFSFAFLVHQVGSFLSAWLGGLCFDAMGSYAIIWIIDAALALTTGLISYLIKEKTVLE